MTGVQTCALPIFNSASLQEAALNQDGIRPSITLSTGPRVGGARNIGDWARAYHPRGSRDAMTGSDFGSVTSMAIFYAGPHESDYPINKHYFMFLVFNDIYYFLSIFRLENKNPATDRGFVFCFLCIILFYFIHTWMGPDISRLFKKK